MFYVFSHHCHESSILCTLGEEKPGPAVRPSPSEEGGREACSRGAGPGASPGAGTAS